jgi:hypothetical protein
VKSDCKFCNPTNDKTWKEDSFYGFQCSTCTKGNTAFVVHVDHKPSITSEEVERLEEILQRRYPDFEPKGSLDVSRSGGHWFAFLVRK